MIQRMSDARVESTLSTYTASDGDNLAVQDWPLPDGVPLREPYIRSAEQRGTQTGGWHVPAGSYFMLGDNRTQSCDSRVWGSVPREHMIGPVAVTYWPLTRAP